MHFYTNQEFTHLPTDDYHFVDNPKRYPGDSWLGELAIVGQNANKDYEVIVDIVYGFDIDAAGTVTLNQPSQSQASTFQLKTISDFNKINNPSPVTPPAAPSNTPPANGGSPSNTPLPPIKQKEEKDHPPVEVL